MLTMFRRGSEQAAAERDAERLIREFGERAFSAAGDMSWREDAGLMSSRSPGYWHRVQQEIGRRLSRRPSSMPMLISPREPHEQAAGLQ